MTPVDAPLPLLTAARRPTTAAPVAVALLVGGWLATVALGLGGGVASLWAVAVALAALVAVGRWTVRLVGDPATGRDRAAARLLLGLVALSFAVRLAGLDHEVAVRSYLDEGTYHRYARSILAGDAFPISFVYPHFYFYLQSMAFWLLDALAPWSHQVLGALSRAAEPIEVEWLTLRLVSATLCALAVVPVFLAARRLGAQATGAAGQPADHPAGRTNGSTGSHPAGVAGGPADPPTSSSASSPPTGLAEGLAGNQAGSLAGGLAGSLAGTLAALLLIFSPLYDGGAHLAICDAPSGAFAVLVVALCGRILAAQDAGERPLRLYLLAGVVAAFAAGTKYPAGVVAVAIVAVALAGMIAARRPRPELVVAGVASLAAFVATMPALVVHAERVFGGGRDILFGVRQYAGGGWIGVQPESFAVYYGQNLVESFGWPALLLALPGLLLAPAALRRRILWLSVFPVVFLLLLGNMSMVVRRNLFPVLPAIAVLLGPLLAVVLLRLGALATRRAGSTASRIVRDRQDSALPRPEPDRPTARRGDGEGPPADAPSVDHGGGRGPGAEHPASLALHRARSAPLDQPGVAGFVPWALVAGLAVAVLALPVLASVRQTVGFVRPTTRDLAAAWIRASLPPGAGLVKESYTPDFAPSELAVRQARFAARLTPAELRQPAHDFLLLASSAYQRFLDDEKTVKEHQQEYGERYRRIRTELPLLTTWEPGPTRLGPLLELYRIVPLEPLAPLREVRWTAADAFVPDEAMRRAETSSLTFTDAGRFAMVKATLAAGSWTCRVEGPASDASVTVRVVDAANQPLATVPPEHSFALSRAEKVFLYLEAPAGTEVTSLACAVAGSPS